MPYLSVSTISVSPLLLFHTPYCNLNNSWKCTGTPYNVDLPAEPAFPASKIIIVGNGECASTCALFTAVAYEKLGIKVATFGGNVSIPFPQLIYWLVF